MSEGFRSLLASIERHARSSPKWMLAEHALVAIGLIVLAR
jgi:hypothetical protein